MTFLKNAKEHYKGINPKNVNHDNHLRILAVFLLFTCFLIFLLVVGGSIYLVQVASQMEKIEQEIFKNKMENKFILENLNKEKVWITSGNSSMLGLLHQRTKRQTYNDRHSFPFIGAHLVGRKSNSGRSSQSYTPRTSTYFKWNDRQNVDGIMVTINQTSSGTFLKVKKTGHYFVYSQLTYSGRGEFGMGHETVKITSSDDGETDVVLMQFVSTQVRASTKHGNGNRSSNIDSGYHGGTFFLLYGDQVGVRPANTGVRNQKFKTTNVNSFFGIFFIAE